MSDWRGFRGIETWNGSHKSQFTAQKLHEQKTLKKAQSEQPRQNLSIGVPRQSLGTSKTSKFLIPPFLRGVRGDLFVPKDFSLKQNHSNN